MKLNFRKISALASSALMFGMTMGIAAAANYPAPFVTGGAANVAVVYGSGAAISDSTAAGNIATSLSGYISGGTASATGETVSLDTSQDRIWLNTSLNSVKTTLTATDLPTVLAEHTFSGNVDAKMTSTIKILTGAAAGGESSSKVIFAKQPKSSNDPEVGISLGGSTQPLYNASVTFPAINFSHADSEGESLTLFGQSFTVSSDTDANTLVLLKEAQKLSLDSDSPSATVTIDNAAYTIELVSASDTAATIKVTDSTGASESKEVSESDSKKIQGLEVGVQTADETNLKLSASIIAGAQKLTFEAGATVTSGSEADPIDGTLVYFGGTATKQVGDLTELTIAVYKPDSSNDAILQGASFIDPVFGSFKLDFAGLNSPLDSADRDTIAVEVVGDDTMSLAMTDDAGNAKTFDFVHNASSQLFLGDDNNETIFVYEGANLTEDKFVVVGNENYGHLLEVTQIYNNTGTSYTDDKVKFQDVISGDTYDTSFASEGTGTVYVEGKGYTVKFQGSGDEGWAYIKYPTSDAAATEFVVYPTIKTENGALVALYEPLNLNMSGIGATGKLDVSKLWLPDGDGYTGVAISYNNVVGQWTIGGTVFSSTAAANANYTTATVGQLIYNFTSIAATNVTRIYVTEPKGTANIDQPGVIIFEGKDDDSLYHAVVVDLETNPAGTSAAGVGVNDVLFSSTKGYYSATLASDTDIEQEVDWFGTFVTTDKSDSDQFSVDITYPVSQVYAQIFVGEADAVISGGGSIGDVLVTDSEISTVNSKNLVVVGGSCINSAAATLVGGAYCGSAWTGATGVGSGQFLIKSYATSSITSKLALLVAGYEAADTTNAATYLRTKTVDTSKAYKGTSGTEATLVVA
ncbi:MAG: hypothetical protein NTW17_03085 [Candidatus Pacearchaeota archaeon]|nr:hypothetical protein [Candidatus Pacearchaeota archaeon]